MSERYLEGKLDTYCPYCDREVNAGIYTSTESLEIRGEQVSYDGRIAVCPVCEQVIGDSRIEAGNLERAYDAYRNRHGIVSSDELRRLRSAYGLSTREFSRFLGFGEQTEHRYETGSMPSRANNAIIKSAMTRIGALSLLEENRERVRPDTVTRVMEYAATLSAPEDESPEWIRLTVYDPSELSPSHLNGFRPWDYPRIRELVILLAQRCHSLFLTKLHKAMFYADNLCFERTSRSLTGLSYAHAFYGPIVHNKDGLFYQLQIDGTICLEPVGDGEVVRPRANALGLFSDDEMSAITDVVQFVNSFEKARQIADYSHGLASWTETDNGELISYASHVGEVAQSIERRMATVR